MTKTSGESLSRRKMLKMLGFSAASAALASCAPRPVAAPELGTAKGSSAQATPAEEQPMPPAQSSAITPLHFRRPRDVAGDAHPFFHNGVCYLYHLNQNFNSRLITATDMLRWQEVPLTHTPTGMGHPSLSPYYVLGVFWDAQAHVFRTYHGGADNSMIGHTSNDLINWDFVPDSFNVPPSALQPAERPLCSGTSWKASIGS